MRQKFCGHHACNHLHPVLCIVPPHILKEIAHRGSPQQRAQAMRTLGAAARFRGQREVLSGFAFAAAAGNGRRTVFDAHGSWQLPGSRVRGEEDGPVADPAVNEAFDGLGATRTLYSEIFHRNSIDGKGMRLDATVHYRFRFDNAMWNGSQMVFGDGDDEFFNRFTIAVDVIGHELAHGVTQLTARLEYQEQPGALNESFSDVFGSLVKQHALRQDVSQADWIIGAGLFTSRVKGVGIRSMKAPGTAYDDPVLGKDPQPSHMNDLYRGDEDNGGVHINSGIPNHAFYLAATAIGGYAWDKTGHIWYKALTERLQPMSQFADAARATIMIAREDYGDGSAEHRAVQNAWERVGLGI